MPGSCSSRSIQPSWVPIVVLPVTFLLLLFPDGHLPSPRWRWFAWSLGVALVVVFFSILLDPRPMEESLDPRRREPARDRGAPSVPRRRAGPDPRDPRRRARFIDRARPPVPSVDRDRAAPAAVAAHGGRFRGVALFRRDVRVARELLGRRGRPGLAHVLQNLVILSFALIPTRDRCVDPAVPPVRHRRRDQQGGAVRRARGVHHGRVRRDRRRRGRARR